MTETPSYYAIIPASVRYDSKICPNAKLLYGELTCLSNKEGYCYASNNYFAELYGVTPQAISKWINQLADQNYVKLEYVYENNAIKERHIYILDNNEATKHEGVSTKVSGGINKSLGGYQQKIKDNNTSINNTSLINSSCPKSKDFRPEAKELTAYLVDENKKDNPYLTITESQKEKWTDSFDKLNRIDGYPFDVIRMVLVWAKNDSFWRKNIMSGNKFREKMPQLYPKATLQGKSAVQNKPGNFDERLF